jgi:hypothetical protein
MSSGWLPEEATTTMEDKARENQRLARATEDTPGRARTDSMVETGIAVHQKNCAAERESRGKGREDCQIR